MMEKYDLAVLPAPGQNDVTDFFLNTWYDLSFEQLSAMYQIDSKRTPPEAYTNDNLLGTFNLSSIHDKFVVIGGPCIGDCNPYPTLEALIEIIYVTESARALRVPGIVFAGVEEELLKGTDGWAEVARQLRSLTKRISDLADSTVTFVDTSHEPVREEISNALANFTTSVDSFRNLYRIGKNQSGLPEPSTRLLAHQRTVMTYLPSVCSGILGKTVSSVLACENIEQIKAIRLASSFANGAVGQLVHLPCPSINGKRHMYWGDKREKLFISGLGNYKKVRRANPLSKLVWETSIPVYLRKSTFEETLEFLFNLAKKS